MARAKNLNPNLEHQVAFGLGAGGAVMACVDRVGYGRWTLPPLNFLEFNVLTVSSTYIYMYTYVCIYMYIYIYVCIYI